MSGCEYALFLTQAEIGLLCDLLVMDLVANNDRTYEIVTTGETASTGVLLEKVNRAREVALSLEVPS